MSAASTYEGAAKGAIAAGGVKSEADPSDPTLNVSTPSAEHDALVKSWKLPRDLMKGTRGMRAISARATGNTTHSDYLPREAGESPASYSARVARSVLFNAFRKTVRDMTGKVFQRAVTLGEDVPPAIKSAAENIDLAGRHLNVFARDLFYDGMQTGITYILVDMPPKLEREDGTPATLAEEQAAGARPYLVHVCPEDLIGFKSEIIDGVVTLTQARIREAVTVPDGPYHEKTIEQIRVLARGTWEKWRLAKDKDGKETWALFDDGTTSVKYIPLIPVYVNRTGFMTGEPPLEDLADLCVAHFQSSSDQRTILHVARVPILFGAGFEADAEIKIGPSQMIRSSNPEATLSYVEHTGAAIAAGQTDIDKLEFQMQVQGLQLLVPTPGQTATGEIRDDAKENSPLAMMALALQDALECAIGYMADFLNIKEDEAPADNDTEEDDNGGSVTVNTDFGVGMIGALDLPMLLQAVVAGKLSKETFWAELKRRDILSDDFKADVEKDRLESEAPTLDSANPMNLENPKVPANGDPAG